MSEKRVWGSIVKKWVDHVCRGFLGRLESFRDIWEKAPYQRALILDLDSPDPSL